MSNTAHASSKRFEILDGMRGIAAITVMLYHFALFANLKPHLGNAPAAVDLFFMLSGFVLAHSYASKLRDGMAPSKYIKKRIVRLYPLFFASLLIGYGALLAFHSIGLSSFNNSSATAGFLVNALFLPFPNANTIQTLSVSASSQIFPSNEALWSLCFEMVASIAFLKLYKQPTNRLASFVALSLITLVLLGVFVFHDSDFKAGFSAHNFIGGFPRVFYGFIVGIVIYRLTGQFSPRSISTFPHIPLKSLLIYIAVFVCLAVPLHLKRDAYYLIQLIFLCPLLVTVGCLAVPHSKIDARAAHFLGWLSYPLYCLHMPVFRLAIFLNDKMHLEASMSVLAMVSVVATFTLSVLLTLAYDEPIRRYFGQSPSRSMITNRSQANG